jgi:hypothetical protein
MTLSKSEQLRHAARNKAIVMRWLEDTSMTYVKLGKEFGLSYEGIRRVLFQYCRAHPDEVRLKQRLENSKIMWRIEDTQYE